MSADNWADCPRCKANHAKAVADHKEKIAALYGKVSADEYEAAKAMALPTFKAKTFREDYEQGLFADGKYHVIYGGQCDACGLAHSFKHSEPVPL